MDQKNSWTHSWIEKKIISNQKNAPAHKEALAMNKLKDLKYEIL